MIAEYTAKIERARQRLEQKTRYLRSQLNSYFHKVSHKVTKTKETYTLPSGVLKLKLPGLENERDEEKLLYWLHQRNIGEFKKRLTIKNGQAVDTETGEIVEGITVAERSPVFHFNMHSSWMADM